MQEVNKGNWKTNILGRNGIRVSHLMFVDDLLLFNGSTEKQMKCVINTFNNFCAPLDQEDNNEKTDIIFSSNVTITMKHKLILISNFTIASNLGKYPGVPINGKTLKKNDY